MGNHSGSCQRGCLVKPVAISDDLVVRRLLIDLRPAFARHWNGGDAFLTAFSNALSMVFPVGERFFIESVRAARDGLVLSVDMLQKVNGFIGQEAAHRHLHGQFNSHLDAHHLANRWEVRAQLRIDRIRWCHTFLSPRQRVLNELALTAALEHYTAILGDQIMSNLGQEGDWFRSADEPLQTLWYWHAAEESEHRAVAFDLLILLKGGYWRRQAWFFYGTMIFIGDLTRQTFHNLYRDRTLWKLSTWRSGMIHLMGRKGFFYALMKAVRYLHPRFHPKHYGDDDLARDWLFKHAASWRPAAKSLV